MISLPEAAARRALFAARAAHSQLPWRWFDARRELGPELRYESEDALVAKGRPLFPGELGCYASHYAAWTEFLAGDDDQLLVLEDDTIVDWGFLAKLAEVDLQGAGIRYLRLYAKRNCAFLPVLRNAIERRRSLIEFLDRPFGTQGYLLTREGAGQLVRHCRRVRRPIDDELDSSWDHGIPTLCVFPFPVIEESTASTIGMARFDQPPVPRRLRVRRYRMRLADRVQMLRHGLQRLVGRRPDRLASLAVT